MAIERATKQELSEFIRATGASVVPRISVIIPVFNMAQYLRKCLESVLAQSLLDIEIICINDGSTDKSVEIIKQYCIQDKRIVFIDQKNQGVAHARNNGIKTAKGEFVCFMDSDDFYPDVDVLADLYRAAKENMVKVCGGSFSYYIEDTNEMKIAFDDNRLWGYTFNEDRLWNYKDYQYDYGYTRFIYDREMLINAELFFPPYIRYEDPPFFVKVMITAGWFYALRRITYRYRVAYKEIKWDSSKIVSTLNGVIDNLVISKENGLNDLHALTLRRLEWIYSFIESEIAGEQSAEIIDLLFGINKVLDENMILQSRFPDADPKTAQKRIAASISKLNYFEQMLLFVRKAEVKNKKIVIWGAGQNGIRTLELFKHYDVKIHAFLDSSPDKTGTSLKGLSIFPPEILNKNPLWSHTHCAVFIASTAHTQIAQQLETAGWHEGKNFWRILE